MARTILAGLAFWLVLASTAANAVDSGTKPPQWSELSPEQQQILAPVAQNWNGMTSRQRVKLLGVAQHYPKMTSGEQKRVQTRLKDWEALTPEQREQARIKYQKFKLLPPEKRQEVKRKWQLKDQQSAPPESPVVASPPALTPASPLPPDPTQ